MNNQTFAKKIISNLRPVVRQPGYQHNQLLINSLAAFNFRPPLNLVFPGERKARQIALNYK